MFFRNFYCSMYKQTFDDKYFFLWLYEWNLFSQRSFDITVLEIKTSQNCLDKLSFGSSRKWKNKNFCAKSTSEQNQFEGKFQPKCIWSIIQKLPRLHLCVKEKIITSHGLNFLHFDQFFQVWNLGFVLANFCLPTIKIWNFREKIFVCEVQWQNQYHHVKEQHWFAIKRHLVTEMILTSIFLHLVYSQFQNFLQIWTKFIQFDWISNLSQCSIDEFFMANEIKSFYFIVSKRQSRFYDLFKTTEKQLWIHQKFMSTWCACCVYKY